MRIYKKKKKEQEQVPAPRDPKKPTPAPENPKQPSPSRSKPSTESKRKENSGQRSGRINLTFERKTPPKESAEQRESNCKSSQNYVDIENHWAREAVKELSKSNIINGMEDVNFQGKKQLSRAEISRIVFNINKIK